MNRLSKKRTRPIEDSESEKEESSKTSQSSLSPPPEQNNSSSESAAHEKTKNTARRGRRGGRRGGGRGGKFSNRSTWEKTKSRNSSRSCSSSSDSVHSRASAERQLNFSGRRLQRESSLDSTPGYDTPGDDAHKSPSSSHAQLRVETTPSSTNHDSSRLPLSPIVQITEDPSYESPPENQQSGRRRSRRPRRSQERLPRETTPLHRQTTSQSQSHTPTRRVRRVSRKSGYSKKIISRSRK